MKQLGSPLHAAEDAQKYLRGIKVRIGDMQSRQSDNQAVFLMSVRWCRQLNSRTAWSNDRHTSIQPPAQHDTTRGDNNVEAMLFFRSSRKL